MSKFHNKDGSLTRYALMCGYIEQTEHNGIRVTLWHEGACYHVRAHNFNSNERIVWDCYDTLTPAKRRFKMLVSMSKVYPTYSAA